MSTFIYCPRNNFDISVVLCPFLEICCRVRTVLDAKFLPSSPLQKCSWSIPLRVVFLSPLYNQKTNVKINNFRCKTLKIQRLVHRVNAQCLFPAMLTIFWFALIWKISAGEIYSFFQNCNLVPSETSEHFHVTQWQ